MSNNVQPKRLIMVGWGVPPTRLIMVGCGVHPARLIMVGFAPPKNKEKLFCDFNSYDLNFPRNCNFEPLLAVGE